MSEAPEAAEVQTNNAEQIQKTSENIPLNTPQESRLKGKLLSVINRFRTTPRTALEEIANTKDDDKQEQPDKSSDDNSSNNSSSDEADENKAEDQKDYFDTYQARIEADRARWDAESARIDAEREEAERKRIAEIKEVEERRQVRNYYQEIQGSTDNLKSSIGNPEFQKESINKALNWLAETPERTEVEKRLLSEEKIIAKWLKYPKLNKDEMENINHMKDTLNLIRKGLADRGRVIKPQIEMGDGSNLDGEPSVPTDPETKQEYAKHQSPMVNAPSIAETGLQPSGEGSKEIGTVFFEPIDGFYQIQPFNMVYRTHLSNIPEFAHDVDENGKFRMGGVGAITRAMLPEDLEFSFDLGKSWRKDMSYLKD